MQIEHKKQTRLEEKQRLSQSIIWRLQREFYDRQGIDAWRTNAVPHYITSNPFIAHAYARVVYGFLRDCQASSGQDEDSSFAPLDASQPLYIVELGSGSGRFGYLFLKKLRELQQGSRLSEIPFKYVMTDFTERNIEHLSAHPGLQPFIQENLLDMARFDVERDRELRLIHGGETLSPESNRNPIVLIANYIFDSTSQDAFYIQNGQLYESLITVWSQRKEDDLNDPEILSRMEISYHQSPVEDGYYQDPTWDTILKNYRKRLPDTAFLFPMAALKCIQNFQRLSGGRMLLLSGDKGYHRDESLLRGEGLPGITWHSGCFSMMVDYQIIGQYFLQHRGEVLHPTHRHESLNVSLFLLGHPVRGYLETRQAYKESVERFGPDDFFTLMREIMTGFFNELSLEQIQALLRLSAYDHQILERCLPTLKKYLPDIGDTQKQEVYESIQLVWDAYLPIGEESDLAFELGVMLLEMEFYHEALEFLNRSVSLYGMESGTAYNMAVCYYSLRRIDEALECINQALELDSEFDAAKTLRIKLESAVSRPVP